MIWFLASQLSSGNPASAVDLAEKNYRAGIAISPGVMEDVEPDEN